MGLIFSFTIYALYAILTLSCIGAYAKRKHKYFVFSYLSLLHINVTSFSNIGIAWTGDFIVMMYVVFEYLFHLIQNGVRTRQLKLYIGSGSRIVLGFWLLIAVSVLISFVREANLAHLYGMAPFARSAKSFVKMSLYVYAALLISKRLMRKIDYSTWVNGLSYSGALPSIAVLYQTFLIASPMFLFHNNNTFTQTPKVIWYEGARGVGLSDESSFFALCITFSFVGSLAGIAYFRGRTKFLHTGMALLQFFAISLSLSRTGMLGVACAMLVFYGQQSIKKTAKIALISGVLVVLVNYLSALSGAQFALIERFMSIFSVEYSASNIERYGIAASLWSMIWTEGAIVGYGFFNYMYYISSHFPEFMQNIHYDGPENIPSFNLVAQLLVEIGAIPFFIFIAYSLSRKKILIETSIHPRMTIITIGFVTLLSALSVNILAFGMPFIFVVLINLQFKEAG